MTVDPSQSPPTPKPRRWWTTPIIVVAALFGGVILGAAFVQPETAEVAAEPQPTATIEVPVPDEANAEWERNLENQEAAADDRETGLDDREAELARRAADLDQLAADLQAREEAIVGEEQKVIEDTIGGDGTYIVSEDISPGTYRAQGSGDSCYWARLSGLSGELGDIITNYIGSANTTVEIGASDEAFETNGCGDWTKQ
jgi:hypothetical protein